MDIYEDNYMLSIEEGMSRNLQKVHSPPMKKKRRRHLYDEAGCPKLKVINIGRVGRITKTSAS